MIDVKLDRGWLAAMSTEVSLSGEELSTRDFPTSASGPWMEAVVPGTVLATLLKNNRIPDPFYGMDNEKVPDIADVGREYYTMWFCTSFATPKSQFSSAWLKFRAINYSARVFVNGSLFSLPGGMFLRRCLDITASVKTEGLNFIAVIVYPPDHPGRVPPEGGQGGDHDIAKDVAAQYVLGWDWMTPIRDRNTGIWDEVTLSFTGPVTIKDPHLLTTFYDDFTRSYLQSSTELVNSTAADARCSIKLHVTLDEPEGEEEFCSVESFSQSEVLIKSGASTSVTLPQQFFYKPQLWWPNGMGKQPLYNVELTVEVDGVESDHWSHRIGFRRIDTWIDKSTRGRMFAVNGKPVFIRGGNWILSDGLLRLSEERYNTDVGFHADMNMNMLRVWAGGLAERPPFYRACDERGILVWQEFWITGDCNGRGVPPSDQNWPLDHDLFLRCARDTVKLLRNHPSLAIWVGGNEQIPAPDIDQALESELQLNPQLQQTSGFLDTDVTRFLDGTRAYIQGSLWSGFADGQGGWSDGPYGIQNPESFFAEDYYPYAFNPEIGSVGVPNAATIRATMPPSAWDPPRMEDVEGGYIKDVPNETWEYHKYIPYCDPDSKVPNQVTTYGTYSDLDDFCEKAQLANYLQYRALIESWNSRMWEKYTGVLIWKDQNPWPGLRGGLYDFLHDQTGGFFGVRSAAEPVHVQLNLATNVVELVNITTEQLDDAAMEASIWNLAGERQKQMVSQGLVLAPQKTAKFAEIQFDLREEEEVCFVLLRLLRGDNSLLSRNFYWLHKEGRDYSQLGGEFRTKKVPVQVTASSEQRGEQLFITAVVKNGTQTGPVAFFLRFSVLQDTDDKNVDQRVLPVTYSDNYFSLVPGESLTVQISFKPPAGSIKPPVLVLQGWNVEKTPVNY